MTQEITIKKKWAVKRMTLNLASTEAEKLQKYCDETGRPATDVIRELVRSLSGDASLGTLSRQIQM